MHIRIMVMLLPVLMIGLPINIYAQDMDDDPVDEESIGGSFTDKLWVGANFGVSEPFSDPGNGSDFATGFAFKAFAQYDLNDKVENLRLELSIGFSSWFTKEDLGGEGSASVIPILIN